MKEATDLKRFELPDYLAMDEDDYQCWGFFYDGKPYYAEIRISKHGCWHRHYLAAVHGKNLNYHSGFFDKNGGEYYDALVRAIKAQNEK